MSQSVLELHPPIDIWRGRDFDFQFDIYQVDLETPQGIAAGDKVRFKVWQTAAAAPTLDIDSIALSSGTFTADAGTDFCTFTGFTPANGMRGLLTTTGTLPAGLSASTLYYLVSSTGSTAKLSLTSGGAAVDITGAGAGTHTFTQQFSTISITTIGATNSTPASGVVKLYAADVDLLTASTAPGDWNWELSYVVVADNNRIKPISHGTFTVNANSTGDVGIT